MEEKLAAARRQATVSGIITLMPADPTNAILKTGAWEVLRPMGLVRRGRSRTWWDDHGWWLINVEFQPSGFSKGSYLNVGICWLWTAEPKSHVTYDLGYRVPGAGGTFESVDQWRALVDALVRRAAEEVVRYRLLLPNLDAAARECLRLEHERVEQVRASQGREAAASWSTWNAAVAGGLAGDSDTAARYFDAVAQSPTLPPYWLPVRDRAAAWSDLVRRDHAAFMEEVRRQTEKQREALKLPAAFPSCVPRPSS